MKTAPLVSVCMVTYNHRRHIGEAIDSVLMQATDFPFELVIGDDCSSDGTDEICRSYKEQYPDRIKLLLSKERLGMTGNFLRTLDACSGKYIAHCDGDDFWTAPDKLQRQADFMEAHEDFTLCIHHVNYYYQNEGVTKAVDRPKPLVDGEAGFEFTNSQRIRGIFIADVSCFYRKDKLPQASVMQSYKQFADQHLYYYLNTAGKGFYINDTMATYRVHEGGVWSGMDAEGRLKTVLGWTIEIYEHEKNDDTSYMLAHRLYYLYAYYISTFKLIKTIKLAIKMTRKYGFGIGMCHPFMLK